MKTIKTNFKMYRLLIAVMLGVLFITSCKKDNSTNNPSNETVTASIFGRVVDENGNSVFGATASAGGKTTTTDVNGIFKISNVTLDKKHAFIKINKTGFFDGSRTFIATSGKTNNVQIRLLSKTLKGSFVASTGATINVTANASVQFPASGIKNADGSIYSGTVKVYAAYLDPTDANLSAKMPGDLIGTRTDNSESLLRSFGMLNIELEDASGNKLNIADGKEATLSMTVPASLVSAAPASIPLWYFDTNTGLWKEEGAATLTGNKYIGTVKHFSWWNYDTPAAAITLTLRLVDASGNPIANQMSILTNIANNDTRYGYSDIDGKITGLVYADAVMKLQIIDNCNNWNFIQNIGPFASSIDLGDILVNFATRETGTYTGKITNCAGNVISNGYVKYSINNTDYYTYADDNGDFSFMVQKCNSTPIITVTTFDIDNLKQGLAQNVTFAAGTTDLGNIEACNSLLDEYIQYRIDGGQAYVVADSLNNAYNNVDGFYIGGGNIGRNGYVRLATIFQVNGVGAYSLQSLIFYKQSPDYNYYSSGANASSLNTIITNYPANIGEYYEGSINGDFINDNTSISHTISCTYRIKRTQ